MSEHILPRTGDVPLRFEGELLADVSTRMAPGGQERNRWYELRLFRTRGGRYVLGIGYRTRWQGEHEVDYAMLSDSPAGVRDDLRLFDPLRDVSGYPPGEAYRQKQDRLERGLRLDWATAVKELFDGLDEEFGEFVE